MNFFDRLLQGEKMPDEWRRSVVVPLYKGKGDIKECGNYREIKLMSNSMKLWERVIEARIRKEVTIGEQQFGFMPGRSTTNAIFLFVLFYLPYLSSIHEKANCIAILWTGSPHSLGSCLFRGLWATCLPHKGGAPR